MSHTGPALPGTGGGAATGAPVVEGAVVGAVFVGGVVVLAAVVVGWAVVAFPLAVIAGAEVLTTGTTGPTVGLAEVVVEARVDGAADVVAVVPALAVAAVLGVADDVGVLDVVVEGAPAPAAADVLGDAVVFAVVVGTARVDEVA